MTKTFIRVVHDGAESRTLGDPPIAWGEGEVTRKRASHIWPLYIWKRLFFRLLRRTFGDEGRVANWSRSWYGPWEVILLNGSGRRFVHFSRLACLEWERKELMKQ